MVGVFYLSFRGNASALRARVVAQRSFCSLELVVVVREMIQWDTGRICRRACWALVGAEGRGSSGKGREFPPECHPEINYSSGEVTDECEGIVELKAVHGLKENEIKSEKVEGFRCKMALRWTCPL